MSRAAGRRSGAGGARGAVHAAVVALVVIGTGMADAADPFTPAEWKKALPELPRYLWAPGPVRDKVREKFAAEGWLDRALTKAQARQAVELLAKGNPFLQDDKVSGTFEVAGGEGEERSTVWVQLPSKYRKAHAPAGLVIAMHGGPAQTMKDADTLAPQEFSYFSGPAQQHECILVAPAWTGDPTARVLELIHTACARWNVDRNRIWLVGHSAGGVASFMVGPPFADRFAGIAPFVCGIEHGKRLENAFLLPVYHVLGIHDNGFFLATGRKNSEKLREVGGPLQVVEKKGGHDVYPDECAAALKWLAARPRTFWAKTVRFTPDRARTLADWYWLRLDPDASLSARPGGKPAFEAKVAGNRIDLEGDGPHGCWLADDLVDLDKPVTLARDGDVLAEFTATRTLRTALDWVESTGDFSAIPTAFGKFE